VNRKKNNDAHERARRLIAFADPEALSAADRLSERLSGEPSSNEWLAAHLESCASCRDFAENAAEAIHRLRAIPVAAGRSLVSTTQSRVRRRALELQRHRERMWTVVVACTAVTLSALLSTFVLWRGFEWLGARAELAPSIWQVAFLVFCMMPALLAAILLLARDKDRHLPNHPDSYQG
jgi:predicted anti-sigma-YlaC factor YlaD